MISFHEYRFLISHLLRIPKEQLWLHPPTLTPEQQKLLESWIKRRENHEPLSKIVGVREFWKRSFFVNEYTLDPRPETETLLEAVLTICPYVNELYRILDLGTGSGCLILSLLDEYPNALGVGMDKSEEALKIALKNKGINDRCTFVLGDWAHGIKGHFDIVVSNPPYIGTKEVLPKEVVDFDPHLALYGGVSGLDAYENLFKSLSEISFSHLFLEVGHTQEQAVRGLSPFTYRQSFKDMQGISRVLYFTT